MLKQRKGLEMTFNWIFSIIIGAIILTFFVYFAVQNTDLFGNLTANRVALELDNAFSGFQTTVVETNLEFNKPIKLEFKCENIADDVRETILINDKGKSILRDKIVFAPTNIEDTKFLLFTSEWKVPYKVANFIFLTSPKEKYKFEYLPENFELPNFLGLSENGKNVKFITDTNPCSIDSNKIIINYGKDEYDEYYGWICTPNSSQPYGFYGKAMIYAAIFSDDFDCLYDLMIKKLNLVSSLYKEKAIIINDIVSRDKLRSIEEIENPLQFKNNVNEIILNNEKRAKRNEIPLY